MRIVSQNLTLDIRGSLKNTRISKNPLVVVDELLANSIDALLIRQAASTDKPPLQITLAVKAETSNLLGDEYDLEVVCADNGCGLGPEQLQAFLTKDTSYKDDLEIPGIGECKGTGRVQFFHHFTTISISSIYASPDGLMHVGLPPSKDRKAIEEDDFQVDARETGQVGTQIRLSQLAPKVKETLFSVQEIHRLFSANQIKQHVLFSLLQRFVSLKQELGDFSIEFSSDLAGSEETAVLKPSDIPDHTSVSTVTVVHAEEEETISADLTVTHYKLDKKDYPLPTNIIGLCAKSSIVNVITKKYLKNKSVANNDIRGFYHIVLVEGALLDEGVNEQRDGFDKIPESGGSGDLLEGSKITFEDIYAVLDDKIAELITPPDWSREEIVDDVAQEFGVSEAMLSHSGTRVNFGDTPREVAKRALTNLQAKVVDETSSLMEMKDAIKELAPDSEDFRRKINDLSWEYASSLKTVDMANLSQLVVRRANIIEVLELAVKEGLQVQKDREDGERRKNEALIHNIFFPMRKDTDEVVDHDVWLLSEEYHYYKYIASDVPLKKIKWKDDQNLFDADVDERVAEMLARIDDENNKGRPDIALFHEEGSVAIVEFKAPGVSLDNHVADLTEYATLLAAKSGGKLRKFYGYLIGDTVNTNRLPGFGKLPGENGFFQTISLRENVTDVSLGQLYSEVLFYEDIVSRARKRIGVYRERLGLR
ncbi:hypothetical protein [Roseobacter sp. S98]|uniref:hypothetical protein n=1 Tax=Roseobacter algicola (ex Choi et al. 2025) (nom. illeg.) TaxID=3092138 RepID=UPI003F516290